MSSTAPELSPVKQALLTIRRQQERIRDLEQAALQGGPRTGTREPVAIVGMGCRFPGGADSPQAFWQLLAQGIDATGEVPPERWSAAELYHPDPQAPGRMATRRGAFCDGVDRFDAGFFHLSPVEVRAMDPQQRLLLEVAWEALEHANIVPESLYASNTGVFVGISTADYFSRQQAQADAQAIDAYYVSGGALSVASGRLSYLLGLNGPSLSVDTACSSSLSALHLACQSLRAGACDLALAGSAGLLLTPEPSIAFSKARMLAPDGRCKTFDAAADGYVRGEGAAVLVLKRLADAQAAGDRILAVVRGTAVNQNGASGGLTVPSGTAQEAVIRQALADAGAAPDDVDCIEAHGTGTALGDPIELRALGRVFASATRTRPLLVGSVKTNIGHLEAAAGMAGVVKTVLALQHGTVPPHLHFSQPTPHFQWQDYPLQVPVQACAWPRADSAARLAGVSSFGFAGSNAHVLIGAPPAAAPSTNPGAEGAPRLLPLSARTPNALRELAGRYASLLDDTSAAALAALCQTAQHCRTRLGQRIAVIATSPQDMAAQLRGFMHGAQPVLPQSGDALAAAARAWTEGGTVDWNAVDPVARPRLILPTYPFQRERYWYDQAAPAPSGAANGAARLLGRRMASPFMAAQFETTLQENDPPFVAEHRVAGQPVVAGAHFLAMALQALQASGSGDNPARQLEGLQFMRALPVPPGTRHALQLGLEHAQAGRARLAIASAPAASMAWTTHATATVVQRPAAGPAPSLSAAQARSLAPADPSLIYAHAAATGIALGPAFRTVRTLYRGEGEALAQLAGPAHPEGLHPGLLDGCFQACIATLRHLPAHTLVPFHIARLDWHPTPATPLMWCHARLCAEGAATDGSRLLCDIELWDSEGRLCLSMQGFEARAADRLALAGTDHLQATGAPPPWQQWLYEVTWQAQPSQAASGLAAGLAPLDTSALEHLIDKPAVQAYGQGLQALNRLAAAYAGQALAVPGLGNGVVPAQQRLWQRLQQIAQPPVEASQGPAVLARQAAAAHPGIAAELRMLERCGTALAEVLQGRRDPLDLLFPGGDTTELAALYGESAAARCMNTLLSAAVAQALQAWPAQGPVRLLEVGAGTGGSTAYLLERLPQALQGRKLDYTFTDVSAHFEAQARERFAGAGLHYRVLDIERDPAAQGFARQGYDIVVAANVLHATRSLRATLEHVRTLLAPGGLLVVLEGVAPQMWLDLVFGLTGGWWRFEDRELRADHALLAPDAWHTLLQESGFSAIQVLSPDTGPAGPGLHQAVLLAQAPLRAGAPRPERWLLLADRAGCGQALAARLAARGVQCELAWAEALDGDPAGLRGLIERLSAAGPLDQVLHLGSLDTAPDDTQAPAGHCRSALALVQALLASGLAAPPSLGFVVNAGAHGSVAPADAALWGLAKVVALEHPELRCRRIALDLADPQSRAAALVRELTGADRAEPEVAFWAGERHVPRLVRRTTPPPPDRAAQRPAIHPEGLYLVTGAFGGLGLLLCESLAALGARHLLLLGRRAPDAAAQARLAALEQTGVRVVACLADVGDRAALAAAIAAAESAGAAGPTPLRGIFHAAGVLDDALLVDQDWPRMAAAMAPKLQGAWNLHECSAQHTLEHFVLYSSAAALLGSAGQASHAAGNAFMDALAQHRRALGLAGLSIAWGAWAEVGAATQGGLQDERTIARWQRQGFSPLAPHQAMQALEHLLGGGSPAHVGVLAIDWPRLLQHRAGDPLLSEFAAEARAGAAAPHAPACARRPSPPETLAQALQAAGPDGRAGLLSDYLCTQVAQILGWPSAADVDPGRSFLELGLDSLSSMELRNRLQSALARPLPTTLTYEHPGIAALAQHLAGLPADEDSPAARPDPAQGLEATDDDALDPLLLELLGGSST